MAFVFLALFVIFSSVHLYGSYHDNQRVRNYSKGGILLALLGYYVCSVTTPSLIVILAILFSWLGDVFLIFKGVKYFTIGGISFMISHIFFIIAYLPNVVLTAVPLYVLLLVALAYGTVVCFIFRALKAYLPKGLYYPMMLYLAINGAMNAVALMQLISRPCPGSAIVFIGAMLFFASDSILFFVRFHKDKPVWKNHFPVMLTYILAEFLIIQGIMMLAA